VSACRLTPKLWGPISIVIKQPFFCKSV